MAMYPKVQGKAQAELDAVIGSQRLPEFSDRPSLPYVNALVKETMRWQLVGPLGKFLPETFHKNVLTIVIQPLPTWPPTTTSTRDISFQKAP